MLESLSLDNIRGAATATIVGVMSLFLGTPVEETAAPVSELSARDVGQYAALPWQDPAAPIIPGNYWDRVRDLNFVVAKLQLTDNMTEDVLDEWAQNAIWGTQQQKKLLLSLNFWDGRDRTTGPMRRPSIYWRRLQRFLDGMVARNALDDFQGIVLAEENIAYGGRPEMLTLLYRLIKQRYDIAVFQWWSPPETLPSTSGWIPADGWIMGHYHEPKPNFRQFVRKYTIVGKPLVVMPWATSYLAEVPPMTQTQWNNNSGQLDVAIEFNLPLAFYWTKDGSAYFDGDRNAPTNDEIGKINQWVWSYIDRTKTLPADYAGLPSADSGTVSPVNFSAATSSIGTLYYLDDFSTQKCIDHASMTGFRDLLMNGQTLSARGFRGRDVNAVLTYQFQGTSHTSSPAVSLSANVPDLTQGQVEVALSANGTSWTPSVATTKSGTSTLSLSSSGRSEFARINSFWVRVTLTGKAGSSTLPVVTIDNLTVTGGAFVP